MNDALRQQLLKAGVVDRKQADKAARETRKEKKERRRKGKNAPAEAPESRARAERSRQEQQERDRELNRQREAEKRQRSAGAQIDDLLRQHALSMRDGSIPFHFTYGSVIRKVEVTTGQQQQLATGRLAVVEHRHRFHLVPADVIPRLRQRNPDLFVALVEAGGDETDDDYSDYPVPDDLQW